LSKTKHSLKCLRHIERELSFSKNFNNDIKIFAKTVILDICNNRMAVFRPLVFDIKKTEGITEKNTVLGHSNIFF